jgi:hypothetical protein
MKVEVFSYNGKEFRLRQMSEEVACEYESALMGGTGWDYKKTRRAMIALMLVDDNDQLIIDDESQLKSMPKNLAGFLFDKCQELNGYLPGELDELRKNSEPAAA